MPEPSTFHLEKVREIPLQLGDNQFAGNIFDIALSDAGLFYLADRTNHTVWAVDKSGKLQKKTGSQGAGPGELAGPLSVSLRGDTLAILEGHSKRISFFTIDGRHYYFDLKS